MSTNTSTWPALFYSPHQDDEAIGMAGAIKEHQAAGRPVYLVLVSRGENTQLMDIMNTGVPTCTRLGDQCPAPGHSHDLGWKSDESLVSGRTSEFYASAAALGVDDAHVINFKLPDQAWGTAAEYDTFVQTIMDQVRNLERAYPGASHKFAAGWLDLNATHKACSDAAYLLRNEISDLRFYHIYAYEQLAYGQRGDGADYVSTIPADAMAAKLQALDAYDTWDPSRNLYSLGYHSVREWMDPARLDAREFVYVLPPDYTYGQP